MDEGRSSGFRGALAPVDNLLEDDRRLREGALAYRTAVVTERYLSLGVSQPRDAPAALRARSRGLPVLGRSSGGTGVLQLPGDIAWAVVLPRDHPLVGRTFPRAFGRLGAPLVDVLAGAGLATEWRPSPDLSPELCLLGSRGEALFAGDTVIGGAAQHLTGTALLHHGVLNLGIDRRLLTDLFQLDPGAAARVAGIRELGVRDPSEVLARRLAVALRDLLARARPP